MFIFFGSKDRQEQRGIVAERCPRCGGIRPFKVFAHFHVGHIYYISLGRGSYSGSTMSCVECGTELAFDEKRYAEVLAAAVASGCSFEELVRRTHPTLVEQLSQAAAPPPPAAQGLPPGATVVCPTCGHPREARFRFCPACGRSD